MKIEHETVARWFNYVREKNDRWFTESFWDTQLKSKKEIIDNIPQHFHGTYYIFGGASWLLLVEYNIAVRDLCKSLGPIEWPKADF